MPTGDSGYACTEEMAPLRVSQVAKRQRMNVTGASRAFHTFIMPRRWWAIRECRAAVAASQGSSEAFSTGSHAQ